MTKHIITTLILCVLSINGFCLECKAISKQNNYEESDFVLIGYVLKEDSSEYKIKILEVFKGNIKSDTLYIQKQSNTVKLEPEETWLLYGQTVNNWHNVNICSWSRNFSEGLCIHNKLLLPYAQPDNNSLQFKRLEKAISLIELNSDINKLRITKTKKRIDSLKFSLLLSFAFIFVFLIIIIILTAKLKKNATIDY